MYVREHFENLYYYYFLFRKFSLEVVFFIETLYRSLKDTIVSTFSDV